MSIFPQSKEPHPDAAEFNAFFPSKSALAQFTSLRAISTAPTIHGPIRAQGVSS